MKKTLLILLSFIGTIVANAQTISSSCAAPDSIVAKYKDDADRLALRKIYRNNLTYKDSVIIPKSHSDIVLNALLAVYNSKGAVRDTVVSLLNIHTFPRPVMNSIIIAADSNLTWMKQLKQGNLNTGNAAIDDLTAKYQLKIDEYISLTDLLDYDEVVFKSASNYNLTPLSKKFEAIPDVNHSEPNSFVGDGNNITDSIYANHVELVFSQGWGDCPAGCINRRFWKFKVYDNCSVEFISSYGDKYKVLGIKETLPKSFALYPNPFSQTIFIEGFSGTFDYTIRNITGQELIKGRTINNRIDNLDKLHAGFYILTIQTDNKTATFRIYRE